MTKKTISITLIALSALLFIGVLIASQTSRSDNSSMAAPTSSHFSDSHKDDGHHDRDAKAADTQPNTVVIQDFAFSPADMNIKVGTTITWTNQDSARHDVAPDIESADFPASKLLAKGESYSHTFTKAGTYSYHCTPHPYMKASITVTD